MRAELFGFRTGANRKGVRPATLAKWTQARERVFTAWIDAGFNYRRGAKAVGMNPGTYWRMVKRALDGLVVAVEARKELAAKLENRNGRKAHRQRCRRAQRRHERAGEAKSLPPNHSGVG